MRTGSRLTLALPIAICLLVVIGGIPTSGAAARAPSSLDPIQTIQIDLRADGDARFTVSVRFALNDSNQTAAFRDVAEDFESGTGTAALPVDAFRRANSLAAEATGREMAFENVTRSTNLTGVNDSDGPRNATGTLSLSFRWTNFAVVDDDRIRVGDAFRTRDGLWLDRLDSNQRLVVRPPAGYYVESAQVGQVNGVLTWRGHTSLSPDELTVVYRERGVGERRGDPTDPDLFAPILGGAALLIAVSVVGMYALRRRGGRGPTPGNGGADGGATSTPPGPDPGGGVEPGADAATDGLDVDDELLSDEERVERLLQYNGGRMRQADIVTETDWSNAKVSQLLSRMDEEGRIDKLRIGRENLISIPNSEDDNGRS